MRPSTPQSMRRSMSARSLTVQGRTVRPSAFASFTSAAVRSAEFGDQILPPAATTIFGAEPWSRYRMPAVHGESSR
jgi:hypothetical protein